MKIKRILSSIIAASMFAVCVPVMADYVEPSNNYDAELKNETYNDGTATNDIDSSKAFDVPAMTYSSADPPKEQYTDIITFDSDVLTKEYFLSFDFNFKTVDGKVPGNIRIDSKQKQGETNKLGPYFSYDNGQLRTQKGSDSYDELGEIEPDTWYTAELEGTMVVSGAKTVFRLYKYEGTTKTKVLVKKTEELNLRQFAADSTNKPNRLAAADVCIDNVRLIQEYPNELTVTADKTTIDAGETLQLDYVMTREDSVTTKYDVTWSVVDGDASITNRGVLTSPVSENNSIVKVQASATINGKELTSEPFEITVNGVNKAGESFDTVEISGESKVKAGGDPVQYSFTASKNDGTPVTGAGVVKWSIYDPSNMNKNLNSKISIDENTGVLTVKDGVIAQTILVKASSTPNGYISNTFPVEIEFGDSQIEKVIAYDACEETRDDARRYDDNGKSSVDGSGAYIGDKPWEVQTFSAPGGYTLTEMDVKFIDSSSLFDFSVAGQNDSILHFCIHGGKISAQYGGRSDEYVDMETVDYGSWYHLEILHSHNDENASCNLYKYNSDGTLGNPTKYELQRRNKKEYTALKIGANTAVDNIKISVPYASEITLTSDDADNDIAAGASVQITATCKRNGLNLLNFSGLDWSVLGGDGQPIIENEDGTIDAEISTNGLLTTRAMGPLQTLTVQAKSGNKTEKIGFTMYRDSIFEVTGVSYDGGAEEDGDAKVVNKNKIVQLTVNKKYEYNDDVTFILAFYDNETGALVDVHMLSAFGSNYAVGSNDIPVEWDIPSEDSNTKIKAFVWTRF